MWKSIKGNALSDFKFLVRHNRTGFTLLDHSYNIGLITANELWELRKMYIKFGKNFRS